MQKTNSLSLPKQIEDKLFPPKKSALSGKCAIAHQPQVIIQSELKTLENIVESNIEGLQNYFQVGAALKKIKSAELYKQAKFTNFIDYCRDRFKLSKTRVYELTRASTVKENLNDLLVEYKIDLTESHCRELYKIKETQLQKDVLKAIVSWGKAVTASEIKRTTQIVKLDNLRQKDSGLPVPSVNTIVRIVGNIDPDKPSFKGYWGVVINSGEFSCDARVFGALINDVHPQHLLKCPTLYNHEVSDTLLLLDRLDAIAESKDIDGTVRNILVEIATGYSILSDWQEYLLQAIEARIF